MAIEVVLDNFSGPLDLLLHLVQKQEVNIHDISISVITEQYLSYLRVMEELSLEIASEFIVMAATLLAIKSRMLLPRPVRGAEEEPDEDPREALIQQLIEYQKCKWAAEHLKSRQALQSQVFSREPLNLDPYVSTDPVPVMGVTLWDLVDAYRKLVSRMPKEEPVATIHGHVISVEQMMQDMLAVLRRFRRCTFFQLLRSARSRQEVVSGFLALLELVKEHMVVCMQPEPFAEIEITLCDSAMSVPS